MTTRAEEDRSLRGLVITSESVIPKVNYVSIRPDIDEYHALGIPRPLALSEAPAVSLVDWVNERMVRFRPGDSVESLVNQHLKINPYINGFASLATLFQSDDSYAGAEWTYPAMRVENLVCQVLGKGFEQDNEITVQLLFPTFESLNQIVKPEDYWQWVYFMSQINRKIIESTIPLAQQAIPRALRKYEVVVPNPKGIIPTRFSGVKDYVDAFNQRSNKEYVNKEIPIWQVYPVEGVSVKEIGTFVKLDIEYAF